MLGGTRARTPSPSVETLGRAPPVFRARGRSYRVAGTDNLTLLLTAIANRDHKVAIDLLETTPSLATAGLARGDEFFLAARRAQVYEGDTALHAAAFSYD